MDDLDGVLGVLHERRLRPARSRALPEEERDDDPVEELRRLRNLLVHGIFGTLCVGLFGVKGLSGLPHDGLFRGGGFAQLWPQLEAVIAVGVFSFGASLVVWRVIDRFMGLRVSAADEELGLDAAEMGMEAYPEFGDGLPGVRTGAATMHPEASP